MLASDFEDLEEEFILFKDRLERMPEPRPKLMDPLKVFSSIQMDHFKYVTYFNNSFSNDACSTNFLPMTELQFCDAILFPDQSQFVSGQPKQVFNQGATFEPYEYLFRTYGSSHIFVHICLEKAIQKLGDFTREFSLLEVVNLCPKHDPSPLLMGLVCFVSTGIQWNNF